MKSGRIALATAAALGLAVLPIASSVRADPPAASASAAAPAPASTPPKKKAPAKAPPAAHGKPAKPTPPPKEAAPPKTVAPASAAPQKGAATSSAHEVVQHESRIEFDERMVRGQSAAGAIFLFQRTPSELKSIVEIPESFRPKTVELMESRGTP
jgi:hypothetical protein